MHFIAVDDMRLIAVDNIHFYLSGPPGLFLYDILYDILYFLVRLY